MKSQSLDQNHFQLLLNTFEKRKKFCAESEEKNYVQFEDLSTWTQLNLYLRIVISHNLYTIHGSVVPCWLLKRFFDSIDFRFSLIQVNQKFNISTFFGRSTFCFISALDYFYTGIAYFINPQFHIHSSSIHQEKKESCDCEEKKLKNKIYNRKTAKDTSSNILPNVLDAGCTEETNRIIMFKRNDPFLK